MEDIVGSFRDDVNTKVARFEGQIKNFEHILLEHIGLERKAQAV